MNANRGYAGQSETGYTLIEVLLAVTLLSLVMGTALMSARIYMDARNRGQSEIRQRWQEYRNLSGLRAVLQGIYDYQVVWQVGDFDKKEVVRPLFLAEINKCEFVTLSPMMAAEHAALGRLWLRQSQTEDNRYSLVYSEAGLDNEIIKNGEAPPSFSHEIVVLEKIRNLKFRYYGIQTYQWNAEAMRRVPVMGWSREYHGETQNAIPEIIEIEVGYGGGLGGESLQFRLADNNFAKKRFINGRSNRE